MPKPRAFTITARDLRDLLTPALALAGTNADLPLLRAVRLESHGRTITATATDRYRAGIIRHTLDDNPDTDKPQAAPAPIGVTIPADALRLALAMFKPGAARLTRRLKVTARDDRTTVEAVGRHWPARMSLDLPHLDGRYPDVRQIIAKAHDPANVPHTDTIGVAPALLAGFAKVTRGRYGDAATLTVRMGPRACDPIALACGDHFVGVLMPRRLETHGVSPSLAPEWAALLTPTTTGKAA